MNLWTQAARVAAQTHLPILALLRLRILHPAIHPMTPARRAPLQGDRPTSTALLEVHARPK